VESGRIPGDFAVAFGISTSISCGANTSTTSQQLGFTIVDRRDRRGREGEYCDAASATYGTCVPAWRSEPNVGRFSFFRSEKEKQLSQFIFFLCNK